MPLRFLNAVHPGDSLQADITVLETRPTSASGRGLVILEFTVRNQDAATVLEMQGTYLFRRMPEQAGP